MAYKHGIKPGDTINNHELTEIFKCGSQGGMRRSHKTKFLVLVLIIYGKWAAGLYIVRFNLHYL